MGWGKDERKKHFFFYFTETVSYHGSGESSFIALDNKTTNQVPSTDDDAFWNVHQHDFGGCINSVAPHIQIVFYQFWTVFFFYCLKPFANFVLTYIFIVSKYYLNIY